MMDYINSPQLAFLHYTCEVIQRLLDLQAEDDTCSIAVETYLESDVKRLFDIAGLVLSNLGDSDRKLRKAFYVVYMLKRFDPEGCFVRLKLQQCRKEKDNENAEEGLFFQAVWHFKEQNIATSFDIEGRPNYECEWNERPTYHFYNVFEDIKCLKTKKETPQRISKEMTTRWNRLKRLNVQEFRF